MSRRSLAAGAAVAAVYLIAAAVSGRLDVFARRPLLEGAGVPPPYRWVAPPPDLAATNIKPTSQTKSVPFKAGSSEPEFASTPDAQVSIILPKGAVPARAGATAVTFRLDPRDPASYRGYPAGLRIRGNVYELRATYQGGAGGPAATLDPPARVILVYPAHTAEFQGATHVVLHSADGRRWQRLPTDNEQPFALQISVSASELGYFAVAARPAPKPKSSSPLPIIGAVVGVAAIAAVSAWRTAQSRAARRRKTKIPRALPKKGGRGPRRR